MKTQKKFIRRLYLEVLRLAVEQQKPHTLPVAYQQALYEEKVRHEDYVLRAQPIKRTRRKAYDSSRDRVTRSQ